MFKNTEWSKSERKKPIQCAAAAAAKSLQSCPTLCDPIDGSPTGSPIPGILQARILEWAAISFSNACKHAKSLQSCPTLCNPIDGSPPSSSVPAILQARVLEWAAISFSNAWKWKVKMKSLSRVRLLATPWTVPTRLLHPWDFPGKTTGVGCHSSKECLKVVKTSLDLLP